MLLADAARAPAEGSRAAFQDQLTEVGCGRITREISDAPPLYYAEDYYRQYPHTNANGYSELGGAGVSCPIRVAL
jgi:peptide-methionine (S)-S-oxide reductase